MTFPLKLNLGAGIDIRRPDFLNVDIQCFPGIDLISDARDLFVIEDSSMEFIVAQHILEYIPREDMLLSVFEWKRLLKDNGILEIRCTDLSQLTKALYLNNISTEMGMHDEMVVALVYGQQINKYDIRYNGFTSSFLQGVLRACGFRIINNVIEGLDFILSAQKK